MPEPTLGGTLYCHNCLSLDFCIEAAIDSLLAVCEEVVVLDAESTDGTREWLQSWSRSENRLRVIDGKWDTGIGWTMPSGLANQAREALTTGWNLMLDADEVLHQDSIQAIRKAMTAGSDRIMSRRVNFYVDAWHYIREGSPHQICPTQIVRLATRDTPAIGDAGTFEMSNACTSFTDSIVIYHYGLVRDRRALLRKCLATQSWYYPEIDGRLLECKDTGEFRPELFVPERELDDFTGAHPVFAHKWLAQHGYLTERR